VRLCIRALPTRLSQLVQRAFHRLEFLPRFAELPLGGQPLILREVARRVADHSVEIAVAGWGRGPSFSLRGRLRGCQTGSRRGQRSWKRGSGVAEQTAQRVFERRAVRELILKREDDE